PLRPGGLRLLRRHLLDRHGASLRAGIPGGAIDPAALLADTVGAAGHVVAPVAGGPGGQTPFAGIYSRELLLLFPEIPEWRAGPPPITVAGSFRPMLARRTHRGGCGKVGACPSSSATITRPSGSRATPPRTRSSRRT